MTKMTIDIPTTVRNQVKASAALMGEKMKDYVITALKEKMARDKLENKFLGDLAAKADKEGYLSSEESEELLKKMRK